MLVYCSNYNNIIDPGSFFNGIPISLSLYIVEDALLPLDIPGRILKTLPTELAVLVLW